MADTEIWSDLNYQLKYDGRGNIKKDVNIDSVKTSIDNILRTSPAERVMLNSFASTFGSMVFDPTNRDTLNRMGDVIKNSIARWDDRVSINSVDFFSIPDKNEVRVGINFQVRGSENIFQHSIKIPVGV